MSGHSKWATIKHKKGAADAKRGAAFTKMIREITTIAKNGGGNIETNAALRSAIDRARSINMPKDNIENAIKKGTGELPGVTYEEVAFDAYGPGGVAMLITGLTDNNNRTTAELRNLLSKRNGKMAPGATSHLFSRKGFISIKKDKISVEDLEELAINAGAEDLSLEGDFHEITTAIEDLEAVKKAVEEKGIAMETAEMTMIPSDYVKVEGNNVKSLFGLLEALEENEDMQHVYHNAEISDEDWEKAAEG